jgi:hypothetical protein
LQGGYIVSKRVKKDVSFSQVDPHEIKLLQHALKQGVFSRYIKRLIDKDMQGIQPAERLHYEPISTNKSHISSVI